MQPPQLPPELPLWPVQSLVLVPQLMLQLAPPPKLPLVLPGVWPVEMPLSLVAQLMLPLVLPRVLRRLLLAQPLVLPPSCSMEQPLLLGQPLVLPKESELLFLMARPLDPSRTLAIVLLVRLLPLRRQHPMELPPPRAQQLALVRTLLKKPPLSRGLPLALILQQEFPVSLARPLALLQRLGRSHRRCSRPRRPASRR